MCDLWVFWEVFQCALQCGLVEKNTVRLSTGQSAILGGRGGFG